MKLGLGQNLLRLSGAGGYSPPMDGLSVAPLVALSSYRQLLSSYTGPLMEVRRTSDDTTMDIGFSPTTGILLTADIATFCGASDGHVQTLYDQSGNGDDVFNTADIAQQPQIYVGGVGTIVDPVYAAYPAMEFTHSGTAGFDAPYLRPSATGNTADPSVTYMVRYRTASGASFGRVVFTDFGSASRIRLIAEVASTGTDVSWDSTNYSLTDTADLADSDERYTVFSSYDNSDGSLKLYSGTTDITENPTTRGNLGDRNWRNVMIGSYFNNAESSAFLGLIQEFAVWYDLLNDDDRTILSA